MIGFHAVFVGFGKVLRVISDDCRKRVFIREIGSPLLLTSPHSVSFFLVRISIVIVGSRTKLLLVKIVVSYPLTAFFKGMTNSVAISAGDSVILSSLIMGR